MNAPLGRIGGKNRLKIKLISMFPEQYDTFIEPFVGAGNIFYSTPKVKNEIINDIDEDMYIIHKGLQNNAQYINDNIERKIDRKLFEKSKGKKDVLSVLYRYKSSFFSLGKSFNTAKQGNKIKRDFSVYGDRLKGVKILNQDFRNVIKKYDSPTSFIYLDPPYESAEENKNYKEFVSPQEVYDSLKNIKGKFMLSYNDSPNIRKIFSKYNIYKVKTKYTDKSLGGAPRDKIELVITNYKIKNI